MKIFVFLLALPAAALAQGDLSEQMLNVKRVYVDRLTGGETAAQMRDLIISSLHSSKLFVITENPERADAFLRGAAEDLVYTDDFQSSDSVEMRGGRERRDAKQSQRHVGGGDQRTFSVAGSGRARVDQHQRAQA